MSPSGAKGRDASRENLQRMLDEKELFRLYPDLLPALLLKIHEMYPELERPPDTEEEILALAGCSREEAYEMRDRLLELLPTLLEEPRVQDPELAVMDAVFNFVVAHPGAVQGPPESRTYSDEYRRFVVGLIEPGGPGEGLSTARLASLSVVPLATLEEWLRASTDQA